MITREQSRTIMDLVAEIRTCENDLDHESAQGYSQLSYEQAELDLKESVQALEQYLETITA